MAKKPQNETELIAKEIAACRDSTGRLTAKAVVAMARDPSKLSHQKFDWDVDRAAQQTWERTAAELIRSVRFVVQYDDDRKITVPFYVSDPRHGVRNYVTTTRVASNAALSERVLREEVDRIVNAIHRAMSIAAAFGLTSSFERMLGQATEIGTRLDDLDEADEARA